MQYLSNSFSEGEGNTNGKVWHNFSYNFTLGIRTPFLFLLTKAYPQFRESLPFSTQFKPSPVTAVKCHWLAIIYHIAYFGQNYSFKGLDSKCKQSIERQHFLKFGDKMLCYFGVGKSICTSLFPMNVEQR